MKTVQLSAPGWAPIEAAFARGFLSRLLGVTHPGVSGGVALRTRAVHTFGLREPLELVAIDACGLVLETRTIAPYRFAYFPRARIVVELPAGSSTPTVGSIVSMRDG